MISLRNLFLAIPLLSLVGCGCVGDEGGTGPSPSSVRPFLLGTKVNPIPVPPTPAPKRIDVFFLMDDSGFDAAAPAPPVNPANQPGFVYGGISYFPAQPSRKKQQAVREVFDQVVANLANDLATAYPNDTFDVAFGVGRYEDFGGAFRTDDKNARPFILNQPILRQKHLEFAARFTPALHNRTSPGSGNDRTRFIEPQSIVEALYQIGAGTGFDGDGGGISGTFGSLAAQTAPDNSGDVPAATYSLMPAKDADNQDQFAAGGLLSSGDLGGVGWRRNALRYVIATSDISGVIPVADDANITVPPAPDRIRGFVSNTAGANGYPRPVRTVNIQSLATVPGTQTQQAVARLGLPGGTVSPPDAHTVQDAITALNVGHPSTNGGQPLNIEVLSIGTLRTAPIPYKPNAEPSSPATGKLPPITPAQLASADPDPTSPTGAPPDQSPFTWMSAFASLTGATRPFPNPVAVEPLALVYNLTSISPTAGNFTTDLRDDLVYRIGEGKGTLAAAPAPGNPGTAQYTFSLAISVGPGSPFFIGATPSPVDSDGGGSTVTVSGDNIVVTVPRYFTGNPAPAPIEIWWVVPIGLVDPLRDTPASDNLPFTITASAPVPPDPARGPHSGTVFYSASLPSATPVGTATLANMTTGCAFVATHTGATPPPFTDRSDLGTCP